MCPDGLRRKQEGKIHSTKFRTAKPLADEKRVPYSNSCRRFFFSIPLVLMGIAVIPAVVHLSRLAYRTSAAVVQLIDELSLARTGWFFADHASFLSVFQQNALELALRTAYMASVLFLGNILRLPGVICPNCGNFFAMGKETAASCRTCVPVTRLIFGRVMPKPHRMLQPLRPHQPVRIHRRTCRPAPLLKTV